MILTFFVVMFVLLMQFLWRYIDDLVGKGLEMDIIAELLLYASAGLVPMAIPLAILLASLMTLGNLGENNELLAMKSAGISLPRILSPLIFITIIISLSAFFFSNNVLPYTNLKITSLLYDVRQQRPELQIKPGVFNNDIEGYIIKIGERDPRTNAMRDILIYDHTAQQGNVSVTVADSGYMKITSDDQHMILTLYHGATYEEMEEKSGKRRTIERKLPSRRTIFEEQTVILELKGFGFERTNEDLFRSNFRALRLSQLKHVGDSLTQEVERRRNVFHSNLITSTILRSPHGNRRDSLAEVTMRLDIDSLFAEAPHNIQKRIIDRALENARSAKSYAVSTQDELYHRGRFIARHWIEWHRKFSLSFACFVFFFIGAPLGAIIRKGGLGMPVVVSILFFLVYYVISLTGEKFVRELIWSPSLGMWVSSLILLPLGIFLSYKATTDSVIMNADFYIETFKKVFRLKTQGGENNENETR